jgi:hypothetical protein
VLGIKHLNAIEVGIYLLISLVKRRKRENIKNSVPTK